MDMEKLARVRRKVLMESWSKCSVMAEDGVDRELPQKQRHAKRIHEWLKIERGLRAPTHDDTRRDMDKLGVSTGLKIIPAVSTRSSASK